MEWSFCAQETANKNRTEIRQFFRYEINSMEFGIILDLGDTVLLTTQQSKASRGDCASGPPIVQALDTKPSLTGRAI